MNSSLIEKAYQYLDLALDKVVFFVPKLLLAALIIWVGLKVIKKLTSLAEVTLEKSGITDNIRPFLLSIIRALLNIGLIFIIAGIIGANLTGFIAILAAAGFAIGMALQGSLGNFASGILILTFKPYQCNDWIKLEYNFGRVEEIGIFNTKMISRDSNTLIIPNSKVTDSILTNYSVIGTRRVEVFVPIPYTESFPRVKKLIEEGLYTISEVLKEPKPVIEIENFDTHSVVLAVRPYAEPDEYWQAVRQTRAMLKKLFHENNYQITYVEGYQFGEIGE